MNIKYFFCLLNPFFFAGVSLYSGLAFDTAMQYTLNQSRQLKSSLSAIEAREGERIDSGLLFNPLFSYSVENVLGNRNWKGWESAESRYEITQSIPLSNRRKYKSNIAQYKIHAAEFEYCYLELKTICAMKKTFLEVAAAEACLKLAEEFRKAAEKSAQVISCKGDEGKISLIEKNKAALCKAESIITWEKANVNLDIARCKLVYFWSGENPDFECIEYPFFEWDCLPSLEECMGAHCNHPLLLKTQFDQLAACEEIRLEKATAIPDVIVTAGYKTLKNTKDKGVILGLAIPLSIFDRNQGNIHKARAEANGVFADYADLKMQLECRLIALHKEGMAAYLELVQIKTTILSLAEETLCMAQEGYAAGKFEYLELLDAEKIYFSAKERYIRALLTYFHKQTEIEYLTL